MPNGARATSGRAGSWRKCAARRFNTGDGIAHGARDRRHAVRQLVGLPRRGLGPATRPSSATRRRRRVQKHSYPLRHHGQRQRRALRRRRRRLPQLHLRQVRRARSWRSRGSSRGRSSTARSRTCCATNIASARSTGQRADTLGGAGGQAGRRRPRRLCSRPSRNTIAAVQRDVPVRPEREGRPRHRRAWRCRSRTGPTRSTSRRSRPIR